MKDEIVNEVRRVRKEIEKQHGNTWEGLEHYLLTKKKEPKKKYYSGQPQRLVKSRVA